MTQTTYSAVLASPLSVLGIRVKQGMLCAIDFLPDGTPLQVPDNETGRRVMLQLKAYFTRPVRFDLPLSLQGTAFQCRVWQAMQAIPLGEVRRYGQLAEEIGSSARAVGNACRANPVPIVVPCHRVVSASGMGGYSGAVSGPLLEYKHRLLVHEGVIMTST